MSALKLAGGALKELRIHLCQTSAASNGVREFIFKDYASVKAKNQDFPILIREASGIVPRVWARYEFGVEKSVSLENSTRDQVLQVLTDLSAAKPGRV